ncbi:hypothetical protein O181_005189 [Austropuccinia psidii MF-1]|uniref:Uncharacterized protein n=1 Tax=Austropuccinia psidii MF-1 TaxID=1389203 RepID=A0A9Q3GFM7_9BASI|nr:hypothetical protein [Austropuccinia psidii MF-1]
MSHTYTPSPATAHATPQAPAITQAPTTSQAPTHAHATAPAPATSQAPAHTHATTPVARGTTCVTRKLLMPLDIKPSHAFPLCACVTPMQPLHCATGSNHLTLSG